MIAMGVGIKKESFCTETGFTFGKNCGKLKKTAKSLDFSADMRYNFFLEYYSKFRFCLKEGSFV